MANELVIEWRRDGIRGLVGSASATTAHVKKVFELLWPQEQSPDVDREAAAEWLKEKLTELGASSKHARLLLPRESVVLKRLEFPDVPDEELPDMVRFQAATKSALPLDQVLLDFLPLPKREGVEGRDVLMATVRRKVADAARTVLSAAGVEPVGLGVSSTALAELTLRLVQEEGADAEQAAAVLVRERDRCEVLVTEKRSLLFSHAAGMSVAASVQSVVSELKRVQVLLQERYPAFRFESVWLLQEAEEPALLAKLQSEFDCPARTVDLEKSAVVEFREQPEERRSVTRFAALVGQLWSGEDARVPSVDFLHPRERPPERDQTKPRVIAAAVGAVVFLVGLFALRAWQVRTLDQNIQILQAQQKKLESELKEMKPELEDAEKVAEWVERRVNSLDVLKDLAETLNGTERYYVTRLVIDQSSGRTRATVQANGVAKDRRDVESLYAALMKGDRYEVQPKEMLRNSQDADYPVRFELEAELKQEKKAARNATEAVASGPAKRTGPAASVKRVSKGGLP